MIEKISDAMSWGMVREATRKDSEMKMLQEDIHAEVGGMVLRGEKLVVPRSFRQRL